MSLAPISSLAVRLANEKKALLDLIREQKRLIAELERSNGEGWALALDLSLEVAALAAERDLLLERCPSDASQVFDQEQP